MGSTTVPMTPHIHPIPISMGIPRGVQRHPSDAKCVTEILWGTKIRNVGEKFTLLFSGKISALNPQIQNPADVISEVRKCPKIQIFRGSAPDSAKGAYSAHPRSRAFGPLFYGSQGLTHYRVGNPTNDRFQM